MESKTLVEEAKGKSAADETETYLAEEKVGSWPRECLDICR